MAKCVLWIPTAISWRWLLHAVCCSSELGRTGPLHALLYQLPGLGSGASLSAAAGICKTSSQNPKARPDLTRFCGRLLTSSGFARVSLHGFLWNCF